MELIPPSAFENAKSLPVVDSSHQELSRAKKEIEALKQENEDLRQKPRSQFSKQEKTFVDPVVALRPQISDNQKYVDELISRQVSEINELKFKLKNDQAVHEREINDLETQLSIQEKQFRQKCMSLEEELQEKEEHYQRQVDRLGRELEQETGDLNNQIEKLSQELDVTKTNYTSQVKCLMSELENEKKNSSDSKYELQEKLRSKDFEIDNMSKQISQLKKYIGETESAHKPQELWKKESETLQNRLKICEAEKENVNSNFQLMNVRLASMNEILTLQERELSKAKSETTDKSKLEAVLLTRWREKVFQVLVQQKSEEIVEKKNHQNWKEKTNDLNEDLLSCKNQIKVLQHSLSDKDAQLEMARNNSLLVNQELHEAQTVALALDDRLVENRGNMDSLKSSAESFNARSLELLQSLNGVWKILNVFGQRISFASSRVSMINSQISRKQALDELKIKSEETDFQRADEQINKPSIDNHLSEELQRVTIERDNLAVQVRKDSQMWNETLNSVKAQYEEEASILKKTIEGLELSLQDKSQNCTRLSDLVVKLQEDITEQNENIEHMKTDIAKHQINTDKALEAQRIADQNEFAEQFAAMERKVNEAQREHAKAVVSSRQLERQMGREKQRFGEQMSTTEHHYNRQVSHLESQLKVLEKERNIMMATLRQEGLISKIKLDRPEPLKLDLEHLDHNSSAHSDYRDLDTSATDKEDLDRVMDKDEPLTAVLEDIESLSAAMMEPDSTIDD